MFPIVEPRLTVPEKKGKTYVAKKVFLFFIFLNVYLRSSRPGVSNQCGIPPPPMGISGRNLLIFFFIYTEFCLLNCITLAFD